MFNRLIFDHEMSNFLYRGNNRIAQILIHGMSGYIKEEGNFFKRVPDSIDSLSYLPKKKYGLIEADHSKDPFGDGIGRQNIKIGRFIKKFLDPAAFDASAELLLVTPDDPNKHLSDLNPAIRKRIKSVVGKSVSQIEFYPGDLHIYPASYGPSSRYIEAISINVLEMACFGVKSFVTKGGVDTWPELVKGGMIYEVDWSTAQRAISTILENGASAKVPEIDKARELVDIKNNLNKIFSAAGLGKFG